VLQTPCQRTDIEYIDAPVKFGGKQVGCHGEQFIRIPIGPFGDAAAGADIPVSVVLAVHRQHSFLCRHSLLFLAHSGNCCFSLIGGVYISPGSVM
jgi:hypothetical protein